MLHWFAKRLHELHEEDRGGEKGFTLIELLVVVIIIGILAAIAIPVFLAQRERANQASCESDTRNAAAAAVSYGASTDGDYSAIDMDALEANGFNQTTGNTTVVAPTGGGNGYTITTTCAGGIGTATTNSDTGRVVFNPAAPAE